SAHAASTPIRWMFAVCIGSIASWGGCGGRAKGQYTLKIPHGISSRIDKCMLKVCGFNCNYTVSKGYILLSRGRRGVSQPACKKNKTSDQPSEQSGTTGPAVLPRLRSSALHI